MLCVRIMTVSLIMLRPRAEGSVAPSNLLATRIGPCAGAGAGDGSVALSEMSVHSRLYNSTASGRLNVSKDIPNGWSIKVTMQKCQDIRNLDTCDYFRSFPLVRAGCSAKQPGEAALCNLFFNHTQPRISCPIKAGSYMVQAFPFLMEDNYLAVSESKISTSLFGYTYKLEGFQQEKSLFCVEASLRLVYIREGGVGTERAPAAPPRDEDFDDLADVY